MTRPKAIRMIAECGEVYTIIVRGHVSADEYQRVYASELDRNPPEAASIRHSWGRWVPAHGASDYPIKRWLHHAEPHARGAFAYTETTADLP